MTRIWTLHNTTIKWTALGIAAMTLLSLAPVKPAAAAPAGTLVIGSVDIARLSTGSTRKAKYDTELRTLADRLDATFKVQAQNLMLAAPDQNELGTLLAVPRPTDAQRARVTALETKAVANAQQLVDLQQKKDPTPADTAQLGALSDMNANGQKIVQDIGAGYQTQLKKLSDDDNVAFTQAVKDAINAVAVQRGLTVVFTSDVAVYTTNDITDDVIKRINK